MNREKIMIVDRKSGQFVKEKIEAEWGLRLIYETCPRFMAPFRYLLCHNAIFSKFLGWVQDRSFSAKKIERFIAHHGIDKKEFEKVSFHSFNEFFTRKLKKEARPLSNAPVITPADGRYLAFENIDQKDQFLIKGQNLSLNELLNFDEKLIERYEKGSLVIARLAPSDYHRFHFPVSGKASSSITKSGNYHSVSPIALKWSLKALTQNKRSTVKIETSELGQVLVIAVGALFVGSIHYTYQPDNEVQKGSEMGYFSFGGSTLILLFEPNQVKMSQDLLTNSKDSIETLTWMGEALAENLKS